MKILLFKTATGYIARTKIADEWVQCGTATDKISQKGTPYIDIDYQEVKQLSEEEKNADIGEDELV